MADVKKQHYVPQFYLRKFATTNEQLYVFDKVRCRSFQSAIHDIAQQKYFYDFGSGIIEQLAAHFDAHPELSLTTEERALMLQPQFVERELAKKESEFAILLDNVLETAMRGNEISETQKGDLSFFLVNQMLRLPRFRQTYINMQVTAVDMISRALLEDRFGNETAKALRVEFDEQYAALKHAEVMYSPKMIEANIVTLMGHTWIIGENHTDQSFYTSDHPVVMRSHVNDPAYGIGSRGIELCFPLSPRYVMILREREYFAGICHLDRKVIPLASENVMYYNSLQVFQCTRQIYCDRGQYTLAAEICAERPDSRFPRVEHVYAERLGTDLLHLVIRR